MSFTGKPGDLVLYKNNQLIALNKPAGLPVQPDPTGDTSLHQLAEIYCQHPVHVVHRLDRPATGVVLFAKNKKALAALNEQFRQRAVGKTYLAVVEQAPPEPAGTLEHLLLKDGRTNKTRVVPAGTPGAKPARLQYRLLGSGDRYHLLEVELLTGRHHQIRAQLSALGCPIKGDVKYGARRSNRDRSIHLHAWKLRFRHPVSLEVEEVVAPLPQDDNLWAALSAFCMP